MGGSEGLMDVINCMSRAAEVTSVKVRHNRLLAWSPILHRQHDVLTVAAHL